MTSRLRALLVLLAAALLATALPASSAPASSYRPTGPWPTWRAPVGGVMRDAVLERGEWVYTNTLWLALGANADGLTRDDYFANSAPDDPMRMSGDLRRALTYEFFGMGRSVTNGDFELPTDKSRWPDGTGEVAELRMTADADELFIRVLWNSYPSPVSQLATLLVETARDDVAVAGPWPDGDMTGGYDVAITLAGAGKSSATGEDGRTTGVMSRDGDHVTEVRVPVSLLPRGPWRLAGGFGLADPDDPTRYWRSAPGPSTAAQPGSGGPEAYPSVLGLFFADDGEWRFDELRQSRLLRGQSPGGASYVLDPRSLTSRRTTHPKPRTGNLSRIYRSSHDFGDGITREAGALPLPAVPHGAPIGEDFNLTYTRTGRLQDYAMRVPASYDAREPWPLIVYLHGFGGTPEEPFRLPLGLVDEAEKRGYLFASLQGRGDTFYRPGLGELDVLEALADIRKHYRVDADRVYLMGHSMGGYGTNNIAARHPDLFAAVAPIQGTDAMTLSPNLRNVPWLMVTSDQDLDAQGAQANEKYEDLSALGYDATLVHYKFKIHEYSTIYDTLPRIFDHFGRHRRAADPGTVTWVRPPADEDFPKLGQVHDGAYWVSDVDAGSVTVSSWRLGGSPPDPSSAERQDVDVDEGGPSMRTMARLRTTRPPILIYRPENALDVHARGTARLTVDVRRARLSLSGLTIRADVDVPVRLTLRDGATATVVALRPGTKTVRRPV